MVELIVCVKANLHSTRTSAVFLRGNVSMDGAGLGVIGERPNDVKADDDEFEMYRKRMMLAYKFRPNPLNNPRRPYY